MKLEYLLGKYNPVFNIVLNDEDETQGLSVVSIVDDPLEYLLGKYNNEVC